ncbi:hypothetical protein [Helicobacter apodemus]|uniref:hypothetical protein n=1 Tax=Helicobacter apodemus TaxID=135569 RepID=UPI00068E1FC1|nr:hypothetical protein [Helicobacter apodemus]
MLASRIKAFTPKLKETTTDSVKTPRDFIIHLDEIRAGEKSLKDSLHRASKMNKIDLYRIQNTPKNGGTRIDWGENVPKFECHKKLMDIKMHIVVFGGISHLLQLRQNSINTAQEDMGIQSKIEL